MIDIEEIIKSRAGRKARYIPGFVYSWLKRFIHQDFINTYLEQNRVGVDFCQGVVEYLGVSITVEGRENLPAADGPFCTFVSNHPLGAIDGVTLGAVLGAHYNGGIRYLVNDLLMNLPGLAPLCVPVNKMGGQSRRLSHMVDQIFAGENHVILFPAGLCSRRINGVVQDVAWGKMFVAKSRQYHRPVVPIHFVAQNSPRFYRVANFCKFFHLPNLAMALLPDEMYRSRGGHFTVRIGKPIPWETFTDEKTNAEWASEVRSRVYEI